MASDPVILCVNCGSSSLKVGMYRLTAGGEVELAEELISGADAKSRLLEVVEAFEARGLPRPMAIGHRLVHGGPHHQRSERVDAVLLAGLRLAVPYAPLHLPSEIEAIEVLERKYPRVPQFACFDTSFHREMPDVARRLPLPCALHEQGIRRYGFHGLSYEYVVETVGAQLGPRAIVAHLGSGASLVALRDRRPVDTTMGLTPAGGIMMATRSGDLDPGVLFHLLDVGYAAGDLDRMLNHESGLLGVSGSTGDMKALLARRAVDPRAALAIDMFCYQARKAIGALSAVLGGLDSLVFTGGIGQNAPAIRRQICEGLGYLGIAMNPARNEHPQGIISENGSKCVVRVVATNEEVIIVRHVRRALFAS